MRCSTIRATMMHANTPPHPKKTPREEHPRRTEEDDFAITLKKTQTKKPPFSHRLVYRSSRTAMTYRIAQARKRPGNGRTKAEHRRRGSRAGNPGNRQANPSRCRKWPFFDCGCQTLFPQSLMNPISVALAFPSDCHIDIIRCNRIPDGNAPREGRETRRPTSACDTCRPMHLN